MKLLVTGGAGYIGSNMVRMLVKKNIDVVVLDSMEHGHKEAIPSTVPLVVGNTGDRDLLNKVFSDHKIDAVIHFAAYLSVEESVKDPIKYMTNNVVRPVSLLDTMEEFGVKYLIFSSSAAVYGFPTIVPIPEDHPKNPSSPYGLSKLVFEYLLGVYSRKKTIQSVSLRYFNASGAALDGMNGEAHDPETHIIPLAIQAATGMRKEFYLFGTDYQTRDGSCERDFIHIEDLASAHLLALDALMNGHETTSYNVATGNGVTNKEVVNAVEKVTGKKISLIEKSRRPGDPNILVADPKKIMSDLHWKPEYSNLESIIASAWKWHQGHPNGYAK